MENKHPHAITSNMLETERQVEKCIKAYILLQHPLIKISRGSLERLISAAMKIANEFRGIRPEDVAIIVESWRLAVLVVFDNSELQE